MSFDRYLVHSNHPSIAVVYVQEEVCHGAMSIAKRLYKIRLSKCATCQRYPSKKAAEADNDAICRFRGEYLYGVIWLHAF